jgi:transcriptional regulator with XRE-family HTH domain
MVKREPRSDKTAWLTKLYRERVGMNQSDLARRCNFCPSYVSRIERGDRPRHQRSTLEDVAQGLGLDAEHRDSLLLSGGYAPEWATDVTVRQLVFLLRHLPPKQERLLRKRIRNTVKDICCEEAAYESRSR